MGKAFNFSIFKLDGNRSLASSTATVGGYRYLLCLCVVKRDGRADGHLSGLDGRKEMQEPWLYKRALVSSFEMTALTESIKCCSESLSCLEFAVSPNFVFFTFNAIHNTSDVKEMMTNSSFNFWACLLTASRKHRLFV